DSSGRVAIIAERSCRPGRSVRRLQEERPMMCSTLKSMCVIVTAVGVLGVGRGRADADDTAPTLLAQAQTAAQEATLTQAGAPAQEGTAPPAVAIEYSDAYRTRAKIHRIASFATLPLFATEGILGQSIYNNPSEAKKNAHLAVAAGIGTLFA